MSAFNANLKPLDDATRAGTRWAKYESWKARQSRLTRIILRLTALLVCMLLLSRGSGSIPAFAWIVAITLVCVLVPLCLFLMMQWVSRRVLWKVRNRLIATYLLMGFAPIVLFVTLTGIAAYMFAGQFATNAAIFAIEGLSFEVRDAAGSVALINLHHNPGKDPLRFDVNTLPDADDVALASLHDGAWQTLPFRTPEGERERSPFDGRPTPAWLHSGFHGIILLDGRLYLCSEVRMEDRPLAAEVMGSLLLNEKTVRSIARDLGYISIHPGFGVHLGDEGNEDPDPDARSRIEQSAESAVTSSLTAPARRSSPAAAPANFSLVGAGDIPPARHFYDTLVLFTAPLPVFAWDSGKQVSAMVSVVSRPTLLYARLFATSVRIGRVVSIGLVVIALGFAVVEAVALLLATRLSRTITRSVAELYEGTLEIDRGNLAHRMPVGKYDQLGVLAASFNSMAGSLDTLLEQQREQQRLLSELAIAQEVQKNLFPQSPVTLQGLELHAVCLPARSVSGDYFDFIFGRGNTLCLALGDISGKGISAALLMASLHSAVRAFSLGAEAGGPRKDTKPGSTELPVASQVTPGRDVLTASAFSAAPSFAPSGPAAPVLLSAAVAGDDPATDSALESPSLLPPVEHRMPAEGNHGNSPSPAHLLELLNHHLYASTPPEKYATLFLAFYDKRTRRLTYSNGGHLPPFILHADGSTRRLDCGGSVVGLLDGLTYLEDTVELVPGDLLFAYSDGLTEPENAQEEEYGETRLLETIRAHQHESLPSLAAVTLESLQHWIGDHEQPDDMTLLLARQH